ncbi:hypothetical protein ENBRE01_1120 [Enteropsectra breve]|nr:hypothetical protein ENBRE01_1120 [Enteropsectra breve]
MANLLLLALLWKHFSSIPRLNDIRMFEKQFQVSITTKDSTDTFDLRDVLSAKVIERALRGIHRQNIELSPKLDLQFKMYDLYEDARLEIESSVSDTYKVHCARIQENMMASDHYEDFVNARTVPEKFDLALPVECEYIRNVFKLTTGWCQELDLFFDDEKVAKTLTAFDYLEIDHDKEVDVFYEQNGVPVHLRIRTIHLFCINIVYLLETQEMLEDYKLILTADEKISVAKAFNKTLICEGGAEHSGIASLIKNTGPLAHYICLLQIKMEMQHVINLFLGTESAYFVYDLLHEENCKSLRLQHKNDLARHLRGWILLSSLTHSVPV